MALIFRRITSYSHVAQEGIHGSADHTPAHVLADAARGVLDRIYANEMRELHELYTRREPQGRATTDIAQTARAATFGALVREGEDRVNTMGGDEGDRARRCDRRLHIVLGSPWTPGRAWLRYGRSARR